MASPSIFHAVAKPRKSSCFQSLTFATGDRFINSVAATPQLAPLYFKDALTRFLHMKDHSEDWCCLGFLLDSNPL